MAEAASSDNRARPKVLVALIGETRATELTADAFRANLLDPLRADLALCVRAGEPHNPLYDWATDVWTFEEGDRDWGRHYDEAARNSDWRVLLQVSPMLFGGVEDEQYPQITMVAVLHFYRWLLWRRMQEAGIPGAYDWIVLSRSDLLWPAPHPDVRYLSERCVYVLDGEQYGGISDRHLVVPRRYFEPVFGRLVRPIFTDPEPLKRRLEQVAARQGWQVMNIEMFLATRLRDVGLWRRLRYLPYIPYAVRDQRGPTTWSEGVLDERAGYYVKYQTERERSEIARETIRDQESWRAHLAPVRGFPRRWRLRRAYRERGLHERAFRRRDPVVRRWNAVVRRWNAAIGSLRRLIPRIVAIRHAAAIRVGRILRGVPGASPVLDARLRKLRRDE